MSACQKYIAEFIGTFALVFAGTGAIIINDVSGGVVTNVGVGLTFEMIILTMIYAVGSAFQPGGNARLFRSAPA